MHKYSKEEQNTYLTKTWFQGQKDQQNVTSTNNLKIGLGALNWKLWAF